MNGVLTDTINMSNILIILGMHRSGTSLVAQWVNALGIEVGDKLLPPSKYNKKGYYEDLDFVNLHKKLLARHNLHESGHEGKIQSPQLTNNEIEEIKILIEQKSKRDQWSWKDPRTCLFIKYYLELLPEAKVLVVIRDSIDVALSMSKRERNNIGKPESNFQSILNRVKRTLLYYYSIVYYTKVWKEYNQMLISELRNNNNVFFTSSEELLNEQDLVLQKKLGHWGFKIKDLRFKAVFDPSLMSKKRNKLLKLIVKTLSFRMNLKINHLLENEKD